jgi:predicted nuclease of predicted toxin-antitoxin system
MAERERLKFLVDVGVSKKVENWLKNQGYDAKCVRDLNPRMPDIELLKIAASENRAVITMDKDFGELVYHSGFPHAGVLLLRLEDARSEEKVRIIGNILKEYSDKILNKFCVYQEGKLRIRK